MKKVAENVTLWYCSPVEVVNPAAQEFHMRLKGMDSIQPATELEALEADGIAQQMTLLKELGAFTGKLLRT